MNRRNFLSNLIKGVAAFSILPPATTYDRIWKARINTSQINPVWQNAEYEYIFLFNQTPFTLMKLNENKPLNDLDRRVIKAWEISKDSFREVLC